MCRILIVDDDMFNQEILLDLLEDFGHTAVCADNGEEAISALKETDHEIGVILMDCQMPVMDGFTATKLIREGRAGNQYKYTPVIAFTAGTDAKTKEQCMSAGMSDYLCKPLDHEKLESKINYWLQ